MTIRGQILSEIITSTVESALRNMDHENPLQYASTMAGYMALVTILPKDDKIQICENLLKTIIETSRELEIDYDYLNLIPGVNLLPQSMKMKALSNFGIEVDSEQEANEVFIDILQNLIEILKEEA